MFHSARIVSLALCAALSSAAMSAQDATQTQPHRQKVDHKLKIKSKYSSSSDATGVLLFLKQPNRLAALAGGSIYGAPDPAFGEDVAITAFFSHPGRRPSRTVDEAHITVVYTGGPRAPFPGELIATVDGREVVLSRQVQANLGASPNPGRQKGERVRSLSFSVMRDRLAELANASEAVLLLPSGERITLTREQRNALADFIGRMSP